MEEITVFSSSFKSSSFKSISSLIKSGDALAEQCHDGDGHGIAEGFVAWSIGAGLGWFAAPRYAGVVIGKAHEALAFGGGEPSHGVALLYAVLGSALKCEHWIAFF